MSIRSYYLLAFLGCILSVGCSTPDEIGYDGGYNNGLVSIAYLKSLYESSPAMIDRDIYIEGTIVSTDQYGAFYKTIILNDKTGGIAIRVDTENYYRVYYRRDTYKVACNSLTISDYGGQLQLGTDNGPIPNELLPTVFSREELPAEEFLPLSLKIDEINPTHIQRWVCLDDVQFEETGPWYTIEGRHIVDREGNRLNVRVSRYAYFADYMLPMGSGYIEGVLSVFNGIYQLEMSSNIFAIMESERF